jgi:nucleoside-diphosphate-sugar epimerase
MIRKFCEAVDCTTDLASSPCGRSSGQRPPQGADATKTVTCWGSGKVSREFVFVADAAEAVVRATEICNDSFPINIGTGREITIADLAALIARLCGFTGGIVWDVSRPDGQPRRRLDTTRAASTLGWQATVDLEEGLRRTIAWWRSRPAG